MDKIEQIPGLNGWWVLTYTFCPETGDLLDVVVKSGPYTSREMAEAAV
jgi:hypothetical protein